MFKKVKYLLTTHDVDKMPNVFLPEIVIVGRSNVGKSSFINSITGQKKLAFTSSKPGKTRAVSFFEIEESFLIDDIPGYGFAKVSKTQKRIFVEMMNSFLKRKEIKGFIVLLDSRIGITNDDLDMINFIKNANIKFLVIGTKSDKINQSTRHHFTTIVKEELNIKPLLYSMKNKKTIEQAIVLIKSLL